MPGVDVGEAVDYDSVLAEARRLEPDVVLMDIKMTPTHSMEGIEAAHVIKSERPATRVVVLSQHDDEGYVWALLEGAMQADETQRTSPRTSEKATSPEAVLTVEDLEAGTYGMLCSIPAPDGEPHAFKGMAVEFTVE